MCLFSWSSSNITILGMCAFQFEFRMAKHAQIEFQKLTNQTDLFAQSSAALCGKQKLPCLTMVAIASLALSEAVIPLFPSFNVNPIRRIEVEHKWTTWQGNQAREDHAKTHLPICADPSNKELFMHVIDQFMDAAHFDWLHLAVGAS